MLKFAALQNFVFSQCVRKVFFSDVKSDLVPRAARLKSELYEKLLMLQPNSPENSKVLKIAVLGCPNSGKSSLVNMLTRWDICAVSGRVNTTRSKQTTVLTQNNVQLCFVDMPGIIEKRRGYNFKLEKSVIRDPHVGIFESDLIICVVDVSHKISQEELSVEILKALYFFKDKPAILVLNKIDKVGNSMKLIDITKRLTEGIVGGRISHKDSYSNRYKKTCPTFSEILEDPKILKLLNKHIPTQALELNLNYNENSDSKIAQISHQPQSTETISNLTENVDKIDDESILGENIEQTFAEDNPDVNQLDEEDKTFLQLLNKTGDKDPDLKFDFEQDDPILDVLKRQLMMKSATKDEVETRRLKWREIGNNLMKTKEISWRHFEDVFAVSSVTGRGIDQLREYLINRAKPGLWYFHSSLISDQEPETLVHMCVLANCLNKLEKEVPYQIKVEINNYEKADDDSIHVHVTIRCKNSRHLMTVLGTRGSNISYIADNSRKILEKCFQTRVYLKLTAARRGIPGEHLRRMRKVNNVKLLYPKSFST